MTMYVSPFTSGEQDIIEDVLGPQIFYLLHKSWNERRQVLRDKRSHQGSVKFCREAGRKELLYHETKVEELDKVLEHMNDTIRAILLALEVKVEPQFYERVLKLADPGNKIGPEPEEGPLY